MQQNQANMQEMKSIFTLFDQEGSQEININQINSLIRDLETINQEQKQVVVQHNGRRLTKKTNSTDNLEEQRDSPKSPTYISVTELKYFPNNKTVMQFNDFCELFNECMTQKEQHDELLQSAFAIFDYDQSGWIDSKKIRKVFSKFKDNTTEEEIQNVLKFCGIVNDRMTLQEFKEFFKKNL
ncbi:hypothetical protein pb186bvf_020857 [Paramecium bursaria]